VRPKSRERPRGFRPPLVADTPLLRACQPVAAPQRHPSSHGRRVLPPVDALKRVVLPYVPRCPSGWRHGGNPSRRIVSAASGSFMDIPSGLLDHPGNAAE
jgi:hypothetical protein